MDKNVLRLPQKLPAGATIGIIAPGGQIVDTDLFYKGITLLHEQGYATKFPRDLWPGNHFFADNDDERLREFHSMCLDCEVDAIMCARGGYGCLRIADQVDLASLTGFDKLFIGFSDITCLHQVLNMSNNLATLHGPVVSSLPLMSNAGIENFFHHLRSDISHYRFSGSFEVLQNRGQKTGISCGGNLSTIVSTLATPLQPDWKGKIVFLEDTGEPLYCIDRMLTQLHLSNMFADIAGVVLGDFCNGLGMTSIEALRHKEYIWNRMLEILGDTVSIIGNFPMGHTAENFCFPLGIPLSLDCDRRCLSVR